MRISHLGIDQHLIEKKLSKVINKIMAKNKSLSLEGRICRDEFNKFFIKQKYKIISIDNYSSISKKNHIKHKRVNYIKGKTSNIEKLIKKPSEINTIFHFGEYRIYQSFLKQMNVLGLTQLDLTVFNFCLKYVKHIFCYLNISGK